MYGSFLRETNYNNLPVSFLSHPFSFSSRSGRVDYLFYYILFLSFIAFAGPHLNPETMTTNTVKILSFILMFSVVTVKMASTVRRSRDIGFCLLSSWAIIFIPFSLVFVSPYYWMTAETSVFLFLIFLPSKGSWSKKTKNLSESKLIQKKS